MLLGARLYYNLCGSVQETEAVFEGKVNEMCRVIVESSGSGANDL